MLVAGHSTADWEELERFLNVDEYIEQFGIPDAFHEAWSHSLNMERFLKMTFAAPQIFAHQRRVVRGQQVKEEDDDNDGFYRCEDDVNNRSLLDVLARFRSSNASDPRDKIFALLGLCSETLGLKSDYTLPVKDVYIDCAKRIIDNDKNLDLLCQGPWEVSASNAERRTDLPSWTPDFSHPGNSRILFAQRSIYSAGPKDLRVPCSVLTSGALVVEGFHVGTIETVRERQNTSDVFVRYEDVGKKWMPESLVREGIERGNHNLCNYFTNEPEPLAPDQQMTSRFQEYWRTLLMDCERYPIRRLKDSDITDLHSKFEKWWLAPEESLPSRERKSVHGYIDTTLSLALSNGWTFAMTTERSYCMVPEAAKPGHRVVVLPRAKVLVVLEVCDGAAERFRFVGTCYVHGFVDGEAFRGEDVAMRLRKYGIV